MFTCKNRNLNTKLFKTLVQIKTIIYVPCEAYKLLSWSNTFLMAIYASYEKPQNCCDKKKL